MATNKTEPLFTSLDSCLKNLIVILQKHKENFKLSLLFHDVRFFNLIALQAIATTFKDCRYNYEIPRNCNTS